MLKTNMKTNNIGIEQDVAVSIYCMQKLPFFVEKNVKSYCSVKLIKSFQQKI